MNKPKNGKGKNIAKGCSYTLAFRLLDEAIKHNYPLQAITIEESILADRLWSALNAGRADGGTPGTLGEALKAWRPKSKANGVHHNAHLLNEMVGDYFERLSKWWDDRNQVLHGIVKSFPGTKPNISADQFVSHAQEIAVAGMELVKIVKTVSQIRIRKENANKRNKE